jgi:hypothetical protein
MKIAISQSALADPNQIPLMQLPAFHAERIAAAKKTLGDVNYAEALESAKIEIDDALRKISQIFGFSSNIIIESIEAQTALDNLMQSQKDLAAGKNKQLCFSNVAISLKKLIPAIVAASPDSIIRAGQQEGRSIRNHFDVP